MPKSYNEAFKDIPGTTVFDATRSRLGYHLNMFCMSLMKADNREAFKADERAYLARFPMTDAQRDAVLARDYNRMIELGGNIYFLAKIGATDGFSFQNLASKMTGRAGGGIRGDDAGRRALSGRQPQQVESREVAMARIIAGITTSHIPAIGAAIDLGKTARAVLAAGVRGLRVRRSTGSPSTSPTCDRLVYNDHASAFSLEIIPTFAIGCAAEFPLADEGWGPRPVPVGRGASGARLAHRAVAHPRRVRHDDRQRDARRPRSDRAAVAAVRPADRVARAVIPLAVNVVQYPPPTGHRCYKLGKAIRKAVESFDEDLNVVIFGTGGMSHQMQGPRAGLINREFDTRFLDELTDDPERARQDPARRLRA